MSYYVSCFAKMTVVSSSKIRGSLYGMLAGDCLGYPFQGKIHLECKTVRETYECRERIIDFVLDFPESWQRSERMPKVAIYSGFGNYVRQILLYSSNVGLSRNVVESLLECNGFKAENMSMKFSETYFTERNYRKYGVTLGIVFENLKQTNNKDINKPAQEQFGDKGSFGSYGAARASPIALFYAKNLNEAIETTKCQCLITHAHPNAVMGAVLQVTAVYKALHCDKDTLEAHSFLNELIDVMIQQEKLIYKKSKHNPYHERFAILSSLLENTNSMNITAKRLGSNNRAVSVVPKAIFCFLNCLQNSNEMDLLNPIVRTISYAIALGGETSTVAGMAGAIAGAYFGDNFIPLRWLNCFEGFEKVSQSSIMLCKRLKLDCWRKLDNNDVSLSCFRGCLLGALAGNCFGKFYFDKVTFSNEKDAQFFRNGVGKFMKDFPNGSDRGQLPYTTIIVMIRNVAESLIACDNFNPSDMAERFAEAFFNGEMRQAYRSDLRTVFKKWKETNYEEPYGPAKDLYCGSNGYSCSTCGALRAVPIALFHATELDMALKTAKMQCLLTDVHSDAAMGSICITAAIHIALNAESGSLDKNNFIGRLQEIIKKEEQHLYPKLKHPQINPYSKKLKECESLLSLNIASTVASRSFENGSAAMNSLCAAIFSFIYCLSPLDGVEIENPFIRTLAYAITLGGNTRSVACMAGAIAGAYYGDSYIPKPWLASLEGSFDLMRYAIILQKKLLT